MSEAFEVIRHTQQDYPASVAEQEARVDAMVRNEAAPCIILTGHPPLYTLGTSGKEGDILSRVIDGEIIAVFESGRGGEVTYHGPGQLVCYVLDDLRDAPDLHRHVWRLEEMVIRTLADFGITACRNKRGIGVWVDGNKIAAVGVRCRKWITFHGIALNIDPNLRHFTGIVPCGMRDTPVTSMRREGVGADRDEVESRLVTHARELFPAASHPAQG